MSLGSRSMRSRQIVFPNFRRFSYVFQEGLASYSNGNPYCFAAARVTLGFRKICLEGMAMNGKTVASGHVSTRVFIRGSDCRFEHQLVKRSWSLFGPYKKSYSPVENEHAPAMDFTASRMAIFSNEKSRLVRDSIRTARLAIST